MFSFIVIKVIKVIIHNLTPVDIKTVSNTYHQFFLSDGVWSRWGHYGKFDIVPVVRLEAFRAQKSPGRIVLET